MKLVQDLTKGSVTGTMLLFSLPLILGNLLQQFYNIADTLIVGKYLGAAALAAVGSSYALMVFLNSILLGMCMGCGVLFSICWGRGDLSALRQKVYLSFVSIGFFSVVMTALVFFFIDDILRWLQVPQDVFPLMRSYLWYIFYGIVFTFIYNYGASLLRAVGNSVIPLLFLGIAAVLNIALDIALILYFNMGVVGAALATTIAQLVSAVGIFIYIFVRFPQLLPGREERSFSSLALREIMRFSLLTCMQQSVMNFGILMVQGLVNSFGTVIMAAFAAAVKIDSFAYMPVQDFGNAFSTFIAQNFGAGKLERIKQGMRSAFITAIGFSLFVSILVCVFAKELMEIFIDSSETAIIEAGVEYLWIEGSFYCGIGCLFLFYGLYRAVKMPEISIVLTVISLGTRVALAYILSAIPSIGVLGIWAAIPIGWILADIAGWLYYRRRRADIARLLMP
jgi:putative MATE family efflux protein